MSRYIDANLASAKRFYQTYQGKGKIVMLNLLKFRHTADYSKSRDLKPESEISGESAYHLYMKNTLPGLKKAGSRILHYGESKHFLIGPESEKWDAVLLVEHASVSKFMEFAESPDYLNNVVHRTAALEDSRLLPSTTKH